MKTQGLSDKKGAVNIKKVIRELHDMLRYKVGMKHHGAWPLVGVVPPSHKQSGVMWCAPNQKGFVRKGHFLMIIERSFDVLYYVRMRIMFVCSLLRLSVWSKISVLYFNNVKKQSLSAIRQGRLEMSRGKVPRNVHYLAIILQIFKMICNVAMHTRCARYCNAAKMFGNSTRQRTNVFYLCTEQNQSTSVMRQGVLGMICGNSTPSLYIYIYSLC